MVQVVLMTVVQVINRIVCECTGIIAGVFFQLGWELHRAGIVQDKSQIYNAVKGLEIGLSREIHPIDPVLIVIDLRRLVAVRQGTLLIFQLSDPGCQGSLLRLRIGFSRLLVIWEIIVGIDGEAGRQHAVVIGNGKISGIDDAAQQHRISIVVGDDPAICVQLVQGLSVQFPMMEDIAV